MPSIEGADTHGWLGHDDAHGRWGAIGPSGHTIHLEPTSQKMKVLCCMSDILCVVLHVSCFLLLCCMSDIKSLSRCMDSRASHSSPDGDPDKKFNVEVLKNYMDNIG